jgi:hypothetical protein
MPLPVWVALKSLSKVMFLLDYPLLGGLSRVEEGHALSSILVPILLYMAHCLASAQGIKD